MLKDMLKRVASAVIRFETGAPSVPQETEAQKNLHKIDQKIVRAEKRIGTLENVLHDLELQRAQMKGEFVAEMRHSAGKEAEQIKAAYYGLKQEIDEAIERNHKALNNAKRRMNMARM